MTVADCVDTWDAVQPVSCPHGYHWHCPSIRAARARQRRLRLEAESGSGINLGARCSLCGRYHVTARCPYGSRPR